MNSHFIGLRFPRTANCHSGFDLQVAYELASRYSGLASIKKTVRQSPSRKNRKVLEPQRIYDPVYNVINSAPKEPL